MCTDYGNAFRGIEMSVATLKANGFNPRYLEYCSDSAFGTVWQWGEIASFEWEFRNNAQQVYGDGYRYAQETLQGQGDIQLRFTRRQNSGVMPITVLGVASATDWSGANETEFFLRATWFGADSATQKKQLIFKYCVFSQYHERMDANEIITDATIIARNMRVVTVPAAGDTSASNW
jgi:hypothetical protein